MDLEKLSLSLSTRKLPFASGRINMGKSKYMYLVCYAPLTNGQVYKGIIDICAESRIERDDIDEKQAETEKNRSATRFQREILIRNSEKRLYRYFVARKAQTLRGMWMRACAS